MGRIIGGLVAGLAVMLIVLGGSEFLAHQAAPKEGSGILLAIVAAAYFLSALAGGLVAARISQRRWAAWAIAGLVAFGAIWSLFQFPHPLWMQIAAVVAPLLGGFVAARLFDRPAAAPGSNGA
jgi:MFS family permease